MLHDANIVIGSDFNQETAEKMARAYIAQLNLAKCTYDWQYCDIAIHCSLLLWHWYEIMAL